MILLSMTQVTLLFFAFELRHFQCVAVNAAAKACAQTALPCAARLHGAKGMSIIQHEFVGADL